MNDQHIVSLLLKRSERALSAMAAAFGKRLHAIAMNILGDYQDAEECVNDTYLALWNTIPPEEPDPLSAYAYRVGRNTALKRLRTDTAKKRNSRYDLSLEELSGCVADKCAADTLDARMLGAAINAFLSRQSAENRSLFLRRYWFGDSVREAAHALGLTENAASVRLNRMRSNLRSFLIKEGYYI